MFQASAVHQRLFKIDCTWSDDDFPARAKRPYHTFDEDFRFVMDVAEGRTGTEEDRFYANEILSGYHADREEYEQAVAYSLAALAYAESPSRMARCHMDIYVYNRALGKDVGDDAQIDRYEQFVETCFRGLGEGDLGAIRLAQNGLAERLEDYALLAAAACAWSVHPNNWNVVEQVTSKEKYEQYLQKFQEEDPRLLRSEWGRRRKEGLAPFSEIVKRENPHNQERRALYLRLCGALEEKDGHSMRTATTVTQEEQQVADRLEGEMKALQTKYTGSDVLRIPEEGLRAYVALARQYIQVILAGNAAVLRSVAENTDPFQEMWDYAILAATNLLWAVHPANREPGDRQQAREQGRYWLDVCFGDMVDAEGEFFLFKKWEERGLPEWREWRSEWLEFLEAAARSAGTREEHDGQSKP